MPKLIKDVNKMNKQELLTYVKNNAKYVNSQLKDLSKNDMEFSKAFQYVQNKLRNKDYMRMNKEGYIEFKSRKAELEKLSYNQIRSIAKKLSDYKATASGTVRGQNKLIATAFDTLKTSDKLSEETKNKLSDMGIDEYKKIVESQNFQDAKEKFGSDQVLKFVGTVGWDKANDIFMDEKIETLHEMYKRADALKDFFDDESEEE